MPQFDVRVAGTRLSVPYDLEDVIATCEACNRYARLSRSGL